MNQSQVPPIRKKSLPRTWKMVYEAIRGKGLCTTEEVVEALRETRLNESSVKKIVTRLVREGYIKGMYTLMDRRCKVYFVPGHAPTFHFDGKIYPGSAFDEEPS